MTERFVYVTYIRATPDKLFAALTLPEYTRTYWCETFQESKWTVGASWKVFGPNGQLVDSGEVLEFDPPHRLKVSWRNEFMPELREEGYSHCLYEIEEVQGGAKLTLTHESDIPGSKAIHSASNGWPGILASLKSLLETGDALEFTKHWPH